MRTPYARAAIGCIFILAVVLIAGCTGNSGTSAPATLVTHPVEAPPVTTSALAVATPVHSSSVPAVSTAIDGKIAAINSSGETFRTVYVNSTFNGQIVTVPVGDRILVRLTENPTTGYSWNATATKGLAIISDTYTAPDSTLMGASGYHEWLISPQTVDTYSFKAVYLRPWVGGQATDSTFNLVIQATKD